MNVFEGFAWEHDEATADPYEIATVINNNTERFEEIGGKNGIGIMFAEDDNYTYIVHYFYDDTAKNDFQHSANLYRVAK
jgi:hypothetical protein|tara:strand:- start:733 stop:969 length:237 start_codon:yes stop_codon:yes gene_type:complete